MGLRRLIVGIDPATINVTEFCAQHGISTWFFYELRRRHRLEGDAALEPRSRAPRRVANKTSVEVEDRIVAERKRLAEEGLDEGAESIHWHLRDLEALPSPSTIWRILKARGFIIAEPAKAPKHAHRSFRAERANDCWQLDDTTWALADRTEVKILNVIDDHSRLLANSVAMATCTGAAALAALAAAAAVLGWPARILSDNASAFRHILAAALAAMGIAARHSRPYHPQTNGKVERFHLTLKKWLAKQPPAATIDELQTQLDAFRHLYNHQRPHRSLQRQFPAQVWADAPKSGPADRPLGTPTTIHTSRVQQGAVWAGRRARISIGSAHNGTNAVIITTGAACHVFIDGHLARRLTLDPDHVNHPLRSRPLP